MSLNLQEMVKYAGNVPLFQALSRADLEAVCSVMILRTFRKNEVIVMEDDGQEPAFFILADGTAEVCVNSSEGKRTILATLRKGDFFGEMAILDGEPRSASVIASGNTKLLMLYRRPFLDMLQRYPKITIQMLIEMSRRQRRSNRQVNTLSIMNVSERVGEIILRIARERGITNGPVTIVPDRPTHQTIADMAGTSRETVSRILSQLRKNRGIAIDGKKMMILDERKIIG